MYCLLAIPFGVLLWARLSIRTGGVVDYSDVGATFVRRDIPEVVFRPNNPG